MLQSGRLVRKLDGIDSPGRTSPTGNFVKYRYTNCRVALEITLHFELKLSLNDVRVF